MKLINEIKRQRRKNEENFFKAALGHHTSVMHFLLPALLGESILHCGFIFQWRLNAH